jgi:hypothetical protein
MKASEKRRIIREFTASLRKTALAAVPHMPKEWDGHELREYIADKANWSRGNLAGKRKRDYANAIATIGPL